MNYKKDFVTRVKKVYPSCSGLHEALEAGSEWAGRYLCDGSGGRIDSEQIIEMIDKGKIDELRTMAQEIKCRDDLWGEWSDLRSS